MFVCEYCGKELSSKPNLKTHQTKAKYCLEKQNKSIKSVIKCGFCDKEFLHKHKKEIHETKCQVRIDNERILEVSSLKEENISLKKEIEELSELKEENSHLKKENRELSSLKEENIHLKKENECLKIEKEKQRAEIYSDLYNKDQQFILEQSKRLVDKAGGTTTTTNIRGKNINMNALNLSQERLESIKDTYTIKHYERGGMGQADWVVENVLKDEVGNLIYKCTDKNRKSFIYRDDKGNIVSDIHAKRLKEAILPVIETKLKEYKKVKCSEMAEVSDDESELFEKYNELYKENRELGNEFDKRLIEKTYV